MAGSPIFVPELKTISKIFGDSDSFYEVPRYQRKYSWEDDQIVQLWDDISSSMDSSEENYFLGSLILTKGSNGYFEVIDGQQRLTSLTILFCTVRDIYEMELKKTNVTLFKKLQTGVKSYEMDKERLKLITQVDQQVKFEQEVQKGIDFGSEEFTKSESRFLSAAKIFRDKLNGIYRRDGIEGIIKIVNFLLDNVVMITIKCSEWNYAIKLFRIMNARGLDLTPADLIKSFLMDKLGKEKWDQFSYVWNQIETTIKEISGEDGETITTLFTYYEYYLLAQNPKRGLYEELEENFKKRYPNEVILDFQKFVNKYGDVYWMRLKAIWSLFYVLNDAFWKSILTASKMMGFNEFEALASQIRKVYYSYWIAGKNISSYKQLLFNIIGWIKTDKSLEFIMAEIDKKIKQDGVIDQMALALGNDAYGKTWLKPLLALIENDIEDDSKSRFIEIYYGNVQVDHILPMAWESNKDWKTKWTGEDANLWVNKLGNLTLLSSKKNVSQQNDYFTKKKQIYMNGEDGTTAFEMSKKIMNENSDWTPESVEKRQKWIVTKTYEILGISAKNT